MSSIANFGWAELQQLPTDVPVGHLIPLLARQSEASVSIDVWAQRVIDWTIPRDNVRAVDLPEFHRNMLVRDTYKISADDVSAFTILGPYDVPFSVYNELSVCEDDEMTPWMSWTHDRHRRVRVQQGKAEEAAAAATTQQQ